MDKSILETILWFNEYYQNNQKLVDKIIKLKNKDLIEEKGIFGEKVYQIKGFTRYPWDKMLNVSISYFEWIEDVDGKIPLQCCKVETWLLPGITHIGKKQYLNEDTLKRLSREFQMLFLINNYYKEIKNDNR